VCVHFYRVAGNTSGPIVLWLGLRTRDQQVASLTPGHALLG